MKITISKLESVFSVQVIHFCIFSYIYHVIANWNRAKYSFVARFNIIKYVFDIPRVISNLLSDKWFGFMFAF